MRILVVGGGGREHALCDHFLRHDHHVVCAPGNAGIARDVQTVPCDLSPRDIVRVATATEAELVVIGPEQPLAEGAVDALQSAGIAAFGPPKAAAELEADKSFMKAVCAGANVPTAASVTVTRSEDAEAFFEALADDDRVVVKASGLCAGKGVVVCASKAEGVRTLREFLGEDDDKAPRFGDASARVVIERFLPGREVSVLALCSEDAAVCLPIARDHKQLFAGGRGPNTGGMGAFAPAHEQGPQARDLSTVVHDEVFLPVLAELKRRGAPFRGLLYAGLMVDDNHAYSVLEFNVRFGDPEAQALLFGLDQDLAPLCLAIAQGKAPPPVELTLTPTCAVVSASAGYPGPADVGHEISLPDTLSDDERVYFAGVKRAGVKRAAAGADQDSAGVATPDALVNSGGRVLCAVARAPDLSDAIANAYALSARIDFAGRQVREDIGQVR